MISGKILKSISFPITQKTRFLFHKSSFIAIITQFDLIEFLICKNKFCSYDKITKSTCPVKIFHGQLDNIIPITHSIELYNLTPNKLLQPTWYLNAGHNDILNLIGLSEYKIILKMLK